MLLSGVFVTLMAIRTRPLTPVIILRGVRSVSLGLGALWFVALEVLFSRILRGVRSVSLGLGALWLVALEIGFSRILHRVRFDVYGVHRL